jgi:hypothetical protein
MTIHHGGRGLGHLSRWPKAAGASAALSRDFTAGSVPGAVTATGGANGTRVNSSGVIVAASAGRLDYDPVTLASRGILVEPARTNTALNSSGMATSYSLINAGDITFTNASGTSPDGTNDATLMQAVNSTSMRVQYLSGAAGIKSVYFKKGTAAYVIMQSFDGTLHNSWVNATTGAVGTKDAAHTVTVTSAGNNWWRIELDPGAGDGGYIMFGQADSDGVNSCTAGLNTLFWGGQLEGATGNAVSSVIVTAGATVTRTADQLAFTVPAGVSTLRVTFDDNTTQDKAVSPGAVAWTSADLNKTRVKTIISV